MTPTASTNGRNDCDDRTEERKSTGILPAAPTAADRRKPNISFQQ
jgi:hypothetical protein